MTENWGNLIDYMSWRGDLTLQQSKFNVIDGLIMANFSYINFPEMGQNEEIPLREAEDRVNRLPWENRFKGMELMKKNTLQLLNDVAGSARFRKTRMVDRVDILHEDREEQFAAISLLLPDDTIFISYRGTDSTLVGWKEDFNMAFTSGVPAQIEAAEYAERIAQKYQLPLRIGGHSKGGNLAVWAGAHLSAEAKSRLLYVYNFDGPGFLKEFLESDEYEQVRQKTISIVPESSIVGVLMGHCEYLTVRSTTHLLMQHDPFTWKIMGKKFDYDTERSKSGHKMEKSINEMLSSMTPEETRNYVEQIYAILKSEDLKTLDDIQKKKLHHIFFTLPKLIKETRKDLPLFGGLFSDK